MNFDYLTPYYEILPYLLVCFIASFLLTPVAGYFAKKYGFVDLPASLRGRGDKTLAQRLHASILPRFGGVAIIIPFIVLTFFTQTIDTQLTGLVLGLILLSLAGVYDDKYELSSSKQFLFQVAAALIVVITGTSIYTIDILGMSFNLESFSHIWDLGLLTYNMVLPADLITIFWILLIINALNWVFGIDALGEGTTFIAALTIMFISVRLGNTTLAILPGLLAFGIAGFVPFNFPPAKIFSGTAGSNAYGYLLAVLSIITGAKVSNAILILTLPLIDMIYVINYRIKHYKHLPLHKRPTQGDRNHLHHRLMANGYNPKQTLVIELAVMANIAVVAFFFAGFGTKLLFSITFVAIISLLSLIIVIGSKRKDKNTKQKKEEEKEEDDDDDDGELSPEEKYAY